ncbi:MAG: DNA repair protein RecN (Recombination protein N) [Flavobacteriales bacterium]|jgi:DNA repair protein RecN (Recombination protein N)
MLRLLSIQNYALIQSLELSFDSGLSAITGETGSGKSILLGALGLVLGKRADHKVIGRDEKKCVVEATFSIGASHKSFFDDNNLDHWPETVLRREISAGGKSRAFINDTPVTLDLVSGLGAELIDIHSQQENGLINDQDFRLKVLDTTAKNKKERTNFEKAFEDWQETKKDLIRLENQNKTAKDDLDYLAFQLRELDTANLDGVDLTELNEEVTTNQNAEEIKEVLNGLAHRLDVDEQSVLNHLRLSLQGLGSIAHVSAALKELFERLKSAEIELSDLSGEAYRMAEESEIDPERALMLETKLNEINRLLQKHNLQDLEELRVYRDDIRSRISLISTSDDRLEELRKDLLAKDEFMLATGGILSKTRLKAIPSVEKRVLSILTELGLERARFEIGLQPNEETSSQGLDFIDFGFSANPGHPIQEIELVASGGEMARVMLAFKSAFSQITSLPCLILDEIDTGVSGEVARKVGKVLQKTSSNMQLLTITHLPQVASLAHHQFKVFKTMSATSTETHVKLLTKEERIIELAEMISGKISSDASLQSARDLMAN